MTSGRFPLTAEKAVRALLIAGFLFTVGANLPGQLSYDSVAQLHEGHLGVRETWGPAVYAAILGGFDRIIPGTGLYLVVSIFIAFAALYALPSLRQRTSWLAPVVALGVVMSPDLVMYQGIVWKDVLFANLAIAGFVALAHIARVWSRPGRPWITWLVMIALFAVAAQVRQNGIVAAGMAALVLAWTARDGGWRAVLGWGGGSLALILILSQALAWMAQPKTAGPDDAMHHGVRILQHYDILGTVAHDRTLRLPEIRKADPHAEQLILTRAAPLYSPERVDYVHLDETASDAFWQVSDRVITDQWRELVVEHPQAYLAHRLDAFRWVFLTPMIDSCLPIYTGVDGPLKYVAELKLHEGVEPSAQRLYNYGTWMLDSPVFSHLSYALISVGVIAALMLRRAPADMAMIGLMLSGLGFAATFFLISIACDYRYLYFLDLSALTGLIYLAIDPMVLRRPPAAAR